MPVAHRLGGLLGPHRFQVVGYGLGLGSVRLARLHRVDCLEHGRRLRPLRFRNLGEDVAVEVHGAALVFGVGEDLGAAVLVHADRCHDRHVLAGAAPASLQVDAVDVDARVFAGQGPASPLLDRLEGLVVEV